MSSRNHLIFLLLLIFLVAFAIRLYDFDDLPLDFHPTRQLFSMIKARGLYYAMSPELPAWQREIAQQQLMDSPMIEPPVLEYLVAMSYKIFGENLVIPRVYSSVFWLVGGFFLFMLASKLTNPIGALFALLFYLFLPYGVFASRSFQPDPLMVMLIIMAVWAMWNWRETSAVKWAVTAGVFTGVAIFVKNVAVFPLLGAALGIVFERGLRASLKDRQTWMVAVLSVMPVTAYTLYGIFVAGFLGQQFIFRFFPEMWTTLAFYLRWKGQLDAVFGFGVVVIAVIGLFVARGRASAFLFGLWGGYLVYGMTFAYHITTHDYYQLPLIPIVAFSLAPVAETLSAKILELRNRRFVRLVLGLLVFMVVALQLWTVRVELVREDFRPDLLYWTEIGDVLGHSTTPVVTIAQDYGGRLAYWGWQPAISWYTDGDLNVRAAAGRDIDLKTRISEFIDGRKYFVVTQFSRLDEQPALKTLLYEKYPIYAEGKGYLIFDLQP